MFIREEAQELIDRIDFYPNEWEQGEYEFINKNNGTKFSTKSGYKYLRINGNHMFNNFEKKAIFTAIERANLINATL